MAHFFLYIPVVLIWQLVQVHLNKLECREKVHFFSCNISKSETFIYFRFITCKVKHLKKNVLILRIRAYSSWKSKISISKSYNIYIWVSINDHPYSINSGYLLYFETTIMGKTTDLAMIQKTNIDTLHKEGKSQKVITERCGCLQSAVSKHIKCKVDWKEEFG